MKIPPATCVLLCAGMVLAMVAGAWAEDAPGAVPAAGPVPEQAKVEKTSDHGFKIGMVEFDNQTREIRVPGVVNMHQGMIEFPVVHSNGRVHEAIFTTAALPMHFETAMRLLRYQPSKEVFPTYPGMDMKNPPPWDKWPDPVYPAAVPESHVQVLVSWSVDGKVKEPVDIRTMLQRPGGDGSGNGSGANTPAIRFDTVAPYWVFTGSTEKMSATVESLGGCLVGIRTEAECSLNTVAADAVHDCEWFADSSRIPAPGTAVTIHIRPVNAAGPAEKSGAPARASRKSPDPIKPTKP